MQSNDDLVDELLRRGVIVSDRVEQAFRDTDRALFVRDELQSKAYENRPLPIGEDQTISQPLTVALMLEDLEVHDGMRVLDVGCGSGYSSALLRSLVGDSGEVIGVEKKGSLVSFAQENLSDAGVQADIRLAGDELGLPGETFDRILVSAAAQEVPQALVSQLAADGRLVIPVSNSLLTVEPEESGFVVVNRVDGFRFVPLVYE